MNTGLINNVVCFEGVSVRFGAVSALDNLNLELRGGELSALLGPNGAGKTTALRLLLGLTRPSQGTVRVLGGDPRRSEARRGVGAMLQDISLPPNLSVLELLRLYAALYPAPLSVNRALELSGLSDQATSRASRLSGGQQRRLSFALAVIGNPELLLLDEPTVAMDVQGRAAFWHGIAELRSGGCTVLLTTHLLEEVDRAADRVIVLSRGVIVADAAPGSVRARVGLSRVRFSSRLDAAHWHTITLPGDVLEGGPAGQFSIRTRQPEALVRAALDLDPALSDLEVSRASLEDAFLSLTGPDQAPTGALA
ncbi:ABC transporter ATP-binding protein [Deinococcus sp.]|uniref:ABC transporter ATP-binding protein n=1 Tax=Deinococcus sp. TaxID=47478 RepID=UPI0025DD7AB2|nr:ABC transporter ATP-binding protein [Deinococcus sp.]